MDRGERRRGAMTADATRPRPDAVIVKLAEEQQGIVTRTQLVSAGVSRHVIDRRLKTGQLRSIHVGVYQVGPVVANRARETAAVLACDGAVVSHRTVGALWKMMQPQRTMDPVDVTLPPGQHHGRRPGIRAHRSLLAEDEIVRLEGLPVTSPARTLLDLSSIASPRELERALAFAERTGLATATEVVSLLNRYPGRPGTRLLRTLIEQCVTPALTRSEAEERLLALIRQGGLPEPEMNVVLHGYEVDCFWRGARLAVEVDGYAYHASARAFVRDRQRDSALAAAGIQVVRVSWQQITEQRDRTLVHLAQALARARP